MSLFAEKVILPFAVAILVGLVLVNPLRFDWQQRVSGALAVLFFAYFVAHSLQIKNASSKGKNSPSGAAIPTSPATLLPHDSQSVASELKLSNPKRSKNPEPPIREKGKPDIHLEQHGGPNAATFGDNSPITLNTTPIPPPERTLSKEKFERLVTELSGLTGSTVNITIVPADDETAALGEQVRTAFQLARWNVSGGITGKISQTTVAATSHGIRATVFEGEGFNCDADAHAPELGKALKAFEAIGLECTVRSKGFLPNDGHAALAIVVGKRN